MFAEDLDVFLQVADFAVGAVYTPAAGSPSTVVGIFDRDYLDPLDNLVEGSAPAFLCKASDVPALAQGDTFVINGETYKSRGNEPDGTGLIRVRLELQ